MDVDGNSTPDRFELLPVLLDHLNDELMMILTHLYKHVRNFRQFKINLVMTKSLRNIRLKCIEGPGLPKSYLT